MKPVALITGVTGQDGWYLSRLLQQRYRVIGLSRGGREAPFSESEKFVPPDWASLEGLVAKWRPVRCFHLAAHHHSAQEKVDEFDSKFFEESYQVNYLFGAHLLRFLEIHTPGCQVFLASSCHVFGDADDVPQDESTPVRPKNLYGIHKAALAAFARLARQRGQHVSVGILYPHESPRRGLSFFSQKIVRHAAACSRDPRTETLVVGSLETLVDWSFAGDVARVMMDVANLDCPGEYLVASGRPFLLREFVEKVYTKFGLRYQDHVVEDPSIVARSFVNPYVGNVRKLRDAIGWAPSGGVDSMVAHLVAGGHQVTCTEGKAF